MHNGRNRENERAHQEPAPSALPSVAPPTPLPPVPTPEEFAHHLRDDATRECGAGQWERCLGDLERAYQEDPAGNGDPHVQKLLREARSHLPDPDAKEPPK